MLCGNVSTNRHLRQFLLQHHVAKKNSAVKDVGGEQEGDGRLATLAEHLHRLVPGSLVGVNNTIPIRKKNRGRKLLETGAVGSK